MLRILDRTVGKRVRHSLGSGRNETPSRSVGAAIQDLEWAIGEVVILCPDTLSRYWKALRLEPVCSANCCYIQLI